MHCSSFPCNCFSPFFFLRLLINSAHEMSAHKFYADSIERERESNVNVPCLKDARVGTSYVVFTLNFLFVLNKKQLFKIKDNHGIEKKKWIQKLWYEKLSIQPEIATKTPFFLFQPHSLAFMRSRLCFTLIKIAYVICHIHTRRELFFIFHSN